MDNLKVQENKDGILIVCDFDKTVQQELSTNIAARTANNDEQTLNST